MVQQAEACVHPGSLEVGGGGSALSVSRVGTIVSAKEVPLNRDIPTGKSGANKKKLNDGHPKVTNDS